MNTQVTVTTPVFIAEFLSSIEETPVRNFRMMLQVAYSSLLRWHEVTTFVEKARVEYARRKGKDVYILDIIGSYVAKDRVGEYDVYDLWENPVFTEDFKDMTVMEYLRQFNVEDMPRRFRCKTPNSKGVCTEICV